MADGLKPHVLRGRGRSRRSRDRAEELRLGAPDPLRRRRELGDRSHMMSALIVELHNPKAQLCGKGGCVNSILQNAD